jgi:hydrogenase-4 component F
VTSRDAVALLVVAAPALGAVLVTLAPRRAVGALAIASGLSSAAVAILPAAVALTGADDPAVGDWVVVDAAAGLFVGVVGIVGAGSMLVSPGYLRSIGSSVVREHRQPRTYYAVLLLFWASLVAVPLAGNLGAAWLVVEATTAASALLVGFGGSPRALEAGWKYLILTSLGLGVALLGIVLLAAGVPGGGLDALSWHALPSYAAGSDTALVAYLLLLAGLAAKIGWAPVHNWLPDAHSEAPPPVSALLSGALLPCVLLVAWRSEQALAPVVGVDTAESALVGFGLVSLVVAIPFLWRSLAWKRLLAYSSLEHMGVIAIGVGFGSTLAIAGVVVHVVGHAVAKALGFYAAAPLLAHEPRAARHQATGVARTHPRLGATLGATLGISLGALAGMPPSPLFASEVLIVAGGFEAGRPWAAAAAAALLALGFLGLAHALVETTVGNAPRRERRAVARLAPVGVVAVVATVALLGLTGLAPFLPDSELVTALIEGAG